MLYLMVGGPDHGTWKEVNPDLISSRGFVSVPHMRGMVYEKAPEFGVPRSLSEARDDRYQLRRFDLVDGMQGAVNGPSWIEALVWVPMPWVEVGAIVGDAFHAACDPFYVPAWEMPRTPRW
jgi:hypothetical protein